jgi:hypothetical protein
MTVLVTTTKVRPNTSISFKPNQIFQNHSAWAGYIECLYVMLSEDELTQTTITRWESREYFESPTLTAEQQLINDEFTQWNSTNNIIVNELVEEE